MVKSVHISSLLFYAIFKFTLRAGGDTFPIQFYFSLFNSQFSYNILVAPGTIQYH